jgi:hypothetical protein
MITWQSTKKFGTVHCRSEPDWHCGAPQFRKPNVVVDVKSSAQERDATQNGTSDQKSIQVSAHQAQAIPRVQLDFPRSFVVNRLD